MNDGGSTADTAAQPTICDVCVVGAGLTGLNALFAASRYLSREQRIILIDQREQVGGMWVDAYRYLRLQQPHGMFTAGNIKWALGRERSYLATRDEVVRHFGHCVQEVRKRVPVDVLLGWTVQEDKEFDDHVELTCVDSHGKRVSISTKHLVKATGLHIAPNEPLAVSSRRIRSVSPDSCTLRDGEMASSDAPVWVVGGGKTAMDTAHELITAYPGREVNMVAGSGTFFASRDQCFPIGLRRWWTGTLVSTIATEVSRRFDGTNEDEVSQWLRTACGTWFTPRTGNFQQGILSAAETRTIADGLNEVVMGHFTDAVDDKDSTQMVLRSGATVSMAPDSWIVNCTGYLLRGEQPYEPYVSQGGRIVSIQQRSATMHLPSYAAYFLTHLMFLHKFNDLELYELDIQEMHRKSKAALPYAMFTVAQYNLSLMSDVLPTKVLLDCGLDLDRWYPLTRRALAAARFTITHRKQRPHQRRTLQTVRERFDVRCGPLDYAPSDFDETAKPA